MKETILNFIHWQYPGHQSSYISELFGAIAKAKSDEQRATLLKDWLKVNSRSRLKWMSMRLALECMFLPSCKFDLPAGTPHNMTPFHKIPEQTSGSIFKVMGSSGYFVPTSPTFIKDPLKRERAFVQLAESMHEAEARTYFAIKDADSEFVPGLTQGLVHSVVPGWIPAPAVTVKPEVKKEEVKVQPKKELPPIKVLPRPGRVPKPKVPKPPVGPSTPPQQNR